MEFWYDPSKSIRYYNEVSLRMKGQYGTGKTSLIPRQF